VLLARGRELILEREDLPLKRCETRRALEASIRESTSPLIAASGDGGGAAGAFRASFS
jgi:hypothetical protein